MIQAVNEVGESIPSDSGTITTSSTHPSQVTNLQSITNDNDDHDICTIEWEKPNHHGQPITSYRIRVDYIDHDDDVTIDDDVDTDDIVTTDVENTYHCISGLMPDSKYR